MTDEEKKAKQAKLEEWFGKGAGADMGFTVGGKYHSIHDTDPESLDAIYNAAGSGAKIYKTSSGKLTNDFDQSIASHSSISLDKKTGTVNISAPDIFLKSDYYKNNLKPTLEAMSQQYRINPDASFALGYKDKDGNDVTKTTEDWVKHMNEGQDGSASIAKMVSMINSEYEEINRKNKEELKLTDEEIAQGKGYNEDLIARLQSQVWKGKDAQGNERTVKDTDLQALPMFDGWDKVWKQYFTDAGIEGYDAETGNVTSKGWHELWSRKDKDNDDDLYTLYITVKEALNQAREEKDAKKAADIESLLITMTQEAPEVGFFEGTKDWVEQFIFGDGGIEDSVAKTGFGMLELLGKASPYIAGGVVGGMGLNALFKELSGNDQSIGEFFADNVVSLARQNVEDFTSEKGERAQVLNPNSKAAATFGGLSVEAAKFVASAMAGGFIGKLAAKEVGGLFGYVAKGSNALAHATAGLMSSTNLGLRMMNTSKFVNSVQKAVSVVKGSKALSSIAGIAGKAGTEIADTTADAIVGCVLDDPDLFNRFISNTDDEEARGYILENIAFATGGWAVIRGAGKAWGGVKIGDKEWGGIKATRGGRVVGAAITQASMATRTSFADAADWIKDRLPGKSTDEKMNWWRAKLEAEGSSASVRTRNKVSKYEKKYQTESFNRNLRESAKQVAAAKTVTEVEQAKVNYMELHNLTDRIQNVVQANMAEIRNTEGLRQALDNVDDSISKINAALRKEGIEFRKADVRLKKGEAGSLQDVFGIDKRTANYISAKIDNQHLEAYIKKYGSNQYIEKQLTANNGYIKAFEQSASAELKAAADESVGRIYDFWYQYNDYASAPERAIYNRAKIEEERTSGLWGTEENPQYAMLQRAKDDYVPYSKRERYATPNEGVKGWNEQREYGATDSYKDPFMTIYNTMIGDSYDIVLKEYENVISDIPGIFKAEDILITASDSELARKMRGVGDKAQAEVAKSVSDTVKNNVVDYSDNYTKYAKEHISSKTSTKEAKSEARKATANLNKSKAGSPDNIRTNLGQRTETVQTLDTEEKISIARKNKIDTNTFEGPAVDDVQNMMASPNEFASEELDEMASDLTGGTSVQSYLDMNDPQQFESWMSKLPPDSQKQVRRSINNELGKGSNAKVNGDRFAEALEKSSDGTSDVSNSPLAREINSGIINNSGNTYIKEYNDSAKKLADTPEVRAKTQKRLYDQRVYEAETVAEEANLKYEKASKEAEIPTSRDETYESIDNMIDDMIEDAGSRAEVDKAFNALDGGDEVKDNLIMTELGRADNVKQFRSSVYDSVYTEVKPLLEAKYKGVKSQDEIDKMAKDIANSYADMASDRLKSRAAAARNSLQESGSRFANSDDMFDEAKRLNQDIEGFKRDIRTGKTNDIVRILDDQGREQFYQVSPAIAFLLNERPRTHIDTNLDKFHMAIVSIFRAGTTGPLALMSYANQYPKDIGAALISANAYRNPGATQELIKQAFGDDFARIFADWSPEELAKYGNTIEEQVANIASQQMNLGKALSPASTEYSAYQFSKRRRLENLQSSGFVGVDKITDVRTRGEKIQEGLDNITEKSSYLHNIREGALRERSYSNAYYDAIKSGYTAKQAQTVAEFSMNNATTNFSRSLTHLENMRRTIPYLGSAINGTKSFYRMLELDPVGMTTRLFIGGVVPVIALTVNNLNSEENRQIYKNIPEWQRASSLVFVSDGQAFTVPLPEQIADLVSPWRQFVEYLHGSNKASFAELAINDLVGILPVDFSGFTSIDLSHIYASSEDEWKARINLGVSRVASQLTDPLTKSGIMLATGVDPYTGNYIDKSYTTTDEDGNPIVVDYGGGSLSKLVRNTINGATGDDNFISASMANAVLKSFIGTGNLTAVNGLIDLAAGVVNSATGGEVELIEGETQSFGKTIESVTESLVEEATGPFTAQTYDIANSEWKRVTSQMYREKDTLLQNKKFLAILNSLQDSSKSLEEIKKLRAQRDDMITAYQERVLNVAKGLKEQIPEAVFDRYKFATVLSLMNMNANDYGTNVYPESALSKSGEVSEKQQGRLAALNTMVDMGFPNIEGRELLGYVGTEFGETKIIYANPLSILAYGETKSRQKSIHQANVETIISDKDWYSKRESLNKQTTPIFSQINSRKGQKGKAKTQANNADYDKIDRLYEEYNADLMKDLAPYIRQYGAENVLNNSQMLDTLADYVQLPNYAKGSLNTKYQELAIPGNAKEAYIRNYIKAIFGVNDTQYDSGTGDWSGRGQWWNKK